MNDGKVHWGGNFVAIATPFKKDGEIDDALFEKNVALMIEEGADGILVAGCTGEAWSLTPDERLHLFRRAAGGGRQGAGHRWHNRAHDPAPPQSCRAQRWKPAARALW